MSIHWGPLSKFSWRVRAAQPLSGCAARNLLEQPVVPNSPLGSYVVWYMDVISDMPPLQSSAVICVTDLEFLLDLA